MEQSKHRDLWLFFVIAIGWSWLFWLPEVFWGLRLYVAPFGPFVAAFLLTYLNEGKEGVVKLLKRAVDYRIGKIWYIPVLLLMPAIAGIAFLGAILSGETVPDLTVLSRPWLILSNFIYILFLGGPLQEEFGWRGYALPRLQARHSAIVSSLTLGLLWAVWHLPLNFVSETGPQYEAALPMFLSSIALMIFMSTLFTWLYNNTGGSLFVALIFHTMVNLSTYVMFPVFQTRMGPLYYMVAMISVTIVVLLAYGHRKLVRQKQPKAPSPSRT